MEVRGEKKDAGVPAVEKKVRASTLFGAK